MELQHHGVKGMKWGVRRFRNEDGTLTAAGKRRYVEKDNGTVKRIKSEHRIRLEDKYREKGMSDSTAELAASRRIKTEKVIAAIAGLTVTAAAAYLVTKVVKDKADFYIKAGTPIQVITNNQNKQFNKPFYAAVDKRDKTRYLGMLGAQHYGYNNVHKAIIEPDSKIRVASRDKAAKVFADLYMKDSAFRESFVRSNENFKGRGSDIRNKVTGAVNRHMSKKALLKEGYDAFNLGLVNHDRDGKPIADKFYDQLRKLGYGAIVDINDQKMSGYNAKKPVIIFNAHGKVNPKVRMSYNDITSALSKTMTYDINSAKAKAYAKEGIKYAGVLSGIGAGLSMANTKVINSYRREHPNSELSDREIYDMLSKR